MGSAQYDERYGVEHDDALGVSQCDCDVHVRESASVFSKKRARDEKKPSERPAHSQKLREKQPCLGTHKNNND